MLRRHQGNDHVEARAGPGANFVFEPVATARPRDLWRAFPVRRRKPRTVLRARVITEHLTRRCPSITFPSGRALSAPRWFRHESIPCLRFAHCRGRLPLRQRRSSIACAGLVRSHRWAAHAQNCHQCRWPMPGAPKIWHPVFLTAETNWCRGVKGRISKYTSAGTTSCSFCPSACIT
jgi:hypothetical protein